MEPKGKIRGFLKIYKQEIIWATMPIRLAVRLMTDEKEVSAGRVEQQRWFPDMAQGPLMVHNHSIEVSKVV